MEHRLGGCGHRRFEVLERLASERLQNPIGRIHTAYRPADADPHAQVAVVTELLVQGTQTSNVTVVYE